jgi:hypothetical protein
VILGFGFAAFAVWAQSPRQARVQAELQKLLEPAGIRVGVAARLPERAAAGSEEVQVRWSEGVSADGLRQPSTKLTMLARTRSSSPVPSMRSLDLHPDQWLCVAVDRQGNLLSWTLIHDPRILRAEEPGPDGVLSGQRLVRSEADFLVSIASDAAAGAIRIFQPRAENGTFQLDPIGEIALGPSR